MTLQEWAGITDFDPRATLAVVFTDIIDSTTLARTVGDKEMFDMLVSHFQAARASRMLYDAFEIKLIGDAYMAAFRTADAALQFALEFRQDTGDPRIAIRVGIHVGQVRIKDEDIYGLMVNKASRLAHVRVDGDEGIFLSASAKADIESEYGTNPQGFRLFRLPPIQLQGLGPREEVWQVVTAEIRAARAVRRRAKQEEAARKNPKPVPPSPVPEVPQLDSLRGFLIKPRLPIRSKD